MLVTEKDCSRCRAMKPASDFTPVTVRGQSRLMSRCKVCCAELAKERRQKNPEAVKAATARYLAKDSSKPKRAALQKKQYDKDPEKYKAKAAVWAAKNPDKTRKYKALNEQKRRAGGTDHVPAWVVRKLFKMFDMMCAYCRTTPAAHIDHIEPLSKGGKHAIENLAPACARCNLTKNARSPEEFAQRTGFDVAGVIESVKQLADKPN